VDVSEIESVMLGSVGNPDTGVVRDVAHVMAVAVHKALNPEKDPVQRVVKPAETR